MVPANRAAIQIWIIFQLFNVIPLFFLCLQFLYKGKHYTMACLSLTTIFDCIISVPIALKHHFIDPDSAASTPQNISTNDPIITNDTYSTNNTDTEFWNETSSEIWGGTSQEMSLILATDTTDLEPICIVQAFLLYSTQLSIGFWILCLMINMWLLLVKATNDIEVKWFKLIFRHRTSIATFIGDPRQSSSSNNVTIIMDNGENCDIETDSEMEITIVESPPSTFGNLKRTTSFSKYKIGDDVLKFEEFRLNHILRSYSIGKNVRHNYGGSRKLDKNGGESTMNSVKSFKSFKSLNRYLENQQNDKNGKEIKQIGGNEYSNDDNTVGNKITIGLTDNDQMISDTLPSTLPPQPIPFMQPKTPGSMRN
ncbi:907_t:CDS:2 [Cetraspora pellucida]|uniref:907_t:CDS:1 n=1 Tax=Cetraspora pellucida TaxID=1433469 RepID=A0ACA9N1V2_9GLOM|nr:907_t:CDS:2 [Cetraspora pellucida]